MKLLKKKTVTLICIILAGLLVLGTIVPITLGGLFWGADAATDLNSQLDKNRQTQNALKEKLNETTAEKEDEQKRKDQLDGEISQIAQKIDTLNATIAKNENEIATKTAEINDLEDEIEESDKLLKRRLRVMYEKGNSTYLELLFSAESFSDLLVRMDMIQNIYDHDTQLIQELGEAKAKVEQEKADIEQIKAANESLRSQLSSQKSAMAEKSGESAAIIDKLEKTEAEIKAEIAQKEKENNRILQEIAAAKAAQSSSGAQNTYSGGVLGWPTTVAGTITSRFGPRTLRGVPNNHTGLDIAVPMGTPVLACEDGVVITSGWSNTGYGNYVVIDHGSISTLYGHNSALLVSVGQKVKKGQQIARAGSTGNSTGPHIHLGVIKNGQYVDPAPYVGR